MPGRSGAAKRKPPQARGPDKDHKLMSERYTSFKSWVAERAMQVTQLDTEAYTRDISKHQGIRQAVEHLQQQLPRTRQ
jgi:hypothetical protein